MLLLPLLVRAAPPAFGNIETEYEDCGALLNNFLAKDENSKKYNIGGWGLP